MNTQKQFTFLVFVVGYLSTCNGASISMEAPNVTADNEIDEEESMMHSHFDRNQTDQHIMISYNWGDSKELATKANIPIHLVHFRIIFYYLSLT